MRKRYTELMEGCLVNAMNVKKIGTKIYCAADIQQKLVVVHPAVLSVFSESSREHSYV